MDRECSFVLDMHVAAAKSALQQVPQSEGQALQAGMARDLEKTGALLQSACSHLYCLDSLVDYILQSPLDEHADLG